jgi:hypothetical protein
MDDLKTDLNKLPKGEYVCIKIEHIISKGERNNPDNIVIDCSEDFIDTKDLNEKEVKEIAKIAFINAKEFLKTKNKLGHK